MYYSTQQRNSLLFPKITQCFRRQEADNDNHHYRLAQQSEPGMMNLHRIDVVVCIAGTAIVNKFAAYLKEYFDAVYQKENHHNEQQGRIASVEYVRICVAIRHQLAGQYFSAK